MDQLLANLTSELSSTQARTVNSARTAPATPMNTTLVDMAEPETHPRKEKSDIEEVKEEAKEEIEFVFNSEAKGAEEEKKEVINDSHQLKAVGKRIRWESEEAEIDGEERCHETDRKRKCISAFGPHLSH